ncbi:MAG: thiosulfate oxidation carrier protein SoxY [Candidatus Rokuibacteriota bacterium]
MRACDAERRRVLGLLVTGVAASVLCPQTGWGAPVADHRPTLDTPILAEDPTAVPVRVSVEHPMEPEHYVRSIEVVLPTDPVAHKGTYRFTPGSGQAWVAFTMRSGVGGVIQATADCTRHGRFVATRDVRVAGDGCATTPERVARERAGNPKLRLARVPRLGEIVEVRTKLDHDSDTGLSLRGGAYVRERPEYFVKRMSIYFDQELIGDFALTSAISPNPIFRFPLRTTRPGMLRVIFANNEGRQWEVSEPVRPAG